METIKHSVIFRHQAEQNTGIQTVRYNRNTIGYVERGTKLIHQVDHYVTVQAGEIFHLQHGVHYIENVPGSDGSPFQQTLFFYSPSELRARFTPPETIGNYTRMCSHCKNKTELDTYPAWPLLVDFFHSVHQYVDSNVHISNPELGHLKLCELVYLLLSHPSCCVAHPVSLALSDTRNTFHYTVRDHIFSDIGLVELAAKCGMSLSMFKNEFKRHFSNSPHKWLIEKRLAHARLQLITTTRSIAEIANECLFNNSSHFIKLFKERYHVTPAVYRRSYEVQN